MFNDINFHASVSDLFDNRGQRVSRELGRGVYRDDTGELIAIAGKNFKPVQHMDLLNPVLDQLNGMGYDIEERRSANPRALYDLKGKKGAWVAAKADNNGARMRVDIILGDFIEPTGSSSYLPKGEDTMFTRLSLLSSHDGSLAIHANSSYLRCVCLNGMVDHRWSINTRAKHTTGLNIEALKAKISNMAGAGSPEDAERFGLYARTPVTTLQAEEFFQRTIAKLGDDPHGNPRFSERLVAKLLDQFRHEDQTVWGVWNAMTHWASHGERKVNASALGTLIGREQRVAQAMRDPRWDEMLAL
jgi:hypothetical protein